MDWTIGTTDYKPRLKIVRLIYSYSGILNVEGPLSFNGQPSNYTDFENDQSLFLANVNNPLDPAGLQTEYQWQMWTPDEPVWQNVTNGDSFNGIRYFRRGK